MKVFIILILTLLTSNAFAISCDCEVRVFSPMTGSHQMKTNSFKTYQLEEYGSYSVKNQNTCRNSCLEAFEKDMPTERLHALLLAYTQELIQQKALGFNCTGLTTVKYPVRVKATLGKLGLGNVADQIEVITHEEVCFN